MRGWPSMTESTAPGPLPKIYDRHWVHVEVRMAHEYRLEGTTARIDALVKHSRWLWSYSCDGRGIIIAREPTHFPLVRVVSWRPINWNAPSYPGKPGVSRGSWRAFCAWETSRGGFTKRRERVVVTEAELSRDERRIFARLLAGDTTELRPMNALLGPVDLFYEGIHYRIEERKRGLCLVSITE